MAKWTKRQQAAHRKKWVKALRSGKYKQAEAVLRDDVGFCCLGVACDISQIGEWCNDGYKAGDDRDYSFLPIDVRDWLGLNSCSGAYFDSRGKSTSLIDKNDGNGKRRLSFKQIANIIEREPEGLIQQ